MQVGFGHVLAAFSTDFLPASVWPSTALWFLPKAGALQELQDQAPAKDGDGLPVFAGL